MTTKDFTLPNNLSPAESEYVLEKYAEYSRLVVLEPHLTAEYSIPFDKFSCVYFLIQGSYTAYVGQTEHLAARISQHVIDGKHFDKVAYVPICSNNLILVEAFNIEYHNPDLNNEIPDKQLLIKRLAKIAKKMA